MLEGFTHHDNADIRLRVGSCFPEDGKKLASEDEGTDEAAKHAFEWSDVRKVRGAYFTTMTFCMPV